MAGAENLAFPDRQGAARQRAILAQALKLPAPGSRLVYATCSLEPVENEEVVRAAAGGEFAVSDVRHWIPGQCEGDGFFACAIS